MSSNRCWERERARQRTFDASFRKAKAGQVTGGRVFGYDNRKIVGPGGRRSHVERVINDDEARDRPPHLRAERKGLRHAHDRERLNNEQILLTFIAIAR